MGETEDKSSCWPIGCYDTNGGHFQIVYNADVFSGPMEIGAINFLVASGDYLPEATYTLTWALSATNYLESSSTLSENIGEVFAQWSPKTLSGEAVGETLEFSGEAFVYDPSEGDLLLDIAVSDWIGYGNDFLVATTDTADLYHNATSSPNLTNRGYAPTTTFSAAPASAVPLPAAGLLLAGGLGALGLMRRRQAA